MVISEFQKKCCSAETVESVKPTFRARSPTNKRFGRSVYVRCGIEFVDFDVVRLDRTRDEANAGILVVLRHGVTDGASRLGI
jgi:hypothetical protein